jgi:FMN phosphatase YigB (HAD superfamily)
MLIRNSVSVVITDVDNTLYDWFRMWHTSFEMLIRLLTERTGLPQETLIAEMKLLHRKYGTSECGIFIEELPSIRQNLEGRSSDLTDVIESYRQIQNAHVFLYPTVLDTLLELKKIGCKLAAYSESLHHFIAHRIKALGLDGVLDYVYSPEDPGIQPTISRSMSHISGFGPCQLSHTVQRYTAIGARKPSPVVLQQIMSDIPVQTDRVIYIGDGLMTDIKMAQDTGIIDVWAKYGEHRSRPEYDALRRLSHWTKAQIEAERQTYELLSVRPTHCLEVFADVLNLFTFVPL